MNRIFIYTPTYKGDSCVRIRTQFKQSVIATHAVEMINDAEAYEIITVDPKYRSGKRIHSDEEYSELYRYLGSTDNADFARIARARKVIFVEGQDARLIRKLAGRIGLDRLVDPLAVPIIQLGGFSQWPRAVNAAWAFKKVLSLDISAFCLFDRDYRCDEEISEFLAASCSSGVHVR